MGNLVFVSIIMPIRNEAAYIQRSLNSVLNQDYPPDLMEILVVDGMSEDATRDIIDQTLRAREIEVAAQQPKGTDPILPAVEVLDNPGHIVPIALNVGLKQGRGDIIIRVDGHCEIQPDYVRRCVELLDKTGADNVGGLQYAEGRDKTSQAIALATSSPFGVGGARFHYAVQPGWVDTVYLGAYRREVFERIGGFDEELVRNQDDEFNFRLTQSGGKIWLEPSLKTVYYSRASFGKLWRQYFQYGLYKVRVIQKRRAVASWRHLIPAGFVFGLFITISLALLTGNYLWSVAVAGPYLVANLLASVWTAWGNWQSLPLLPLAFVILHISYGCGFLAGLWRWRQYWKYLLHV
ncbi:MAG: glycosyltransferase family 2 protein [Desulfobacca sp.]|nr:glycosyltransferase family 2 protein [Desulfobacca sp.]